MHHIRVARREDCKSIVRLIQLLADYQDMSDGPKLTAEKLEEDGFGSEPAFHCNVATIDDICVGYTLYTYGFSTFYGPNVYMEDLFVMKEHRGKGIGADLWRSVVKESLEKGCSTFDFSVLRHNSSSIEFYERKGAKNKTRLDNWDTYNLDRKGMELLVNGSRRT
uniref:Diamine acetyltransferase 2 n=1 Tax=Caligus clemensi TaxID=344056 RepID=C1C2N5_CALCM|nr:Diamine acetyltransferase 2 [Caligus clemensi]